jgi:hypothetical protein
LKPPPHGKPCYNFPAAPSAELRADLQALIAASLAEWAQKKWL